MGEDQLAAHGQERVSPAGRRVLVLGVDTQVAGARPVGRAAVEARRAELDGARGAELEERPEPRGQERVAEAAVAEGLLVVAVEDADDRLEVHGQRRDPGHLEPVLRQPLLAEEPREHRGRVRLGPVVEMELVEEPEPEPLAASLGSEAERQARELEVGLGQPELEGALAVLELLGGLEDHRRAGVRVDLAEEGQLDLAWDHPVLAPGERPDLVALHPARREVGDEVPGDPHVEEEPPARRCRRARLARRRLRVEGEGLPRSGEVVEARQRDRAAALAGGGGAAAT